MKNPTIMSAVRSMSLLTFSYENQTRVVEPHAYGRTKAGPNVLRAYQTNTRRGWRLFREDEMYRIQVVPDTFRTRRPGYKRGDKAMEEIYIQL